MTGGCPSESYCDSTTGRCVPGCRGDADCAPPTRICEGGACTDGCVPGTCSPGSFCDAAASGRCLPGCLDDSNCDVPNTYCLNNTCVAGCVTTGCGFNQHCDTTTGRCVAGCLEDGHCSPPDFICEAGACAAGCLTTGCPVGNYCDGTSGRCTPGCLSDGDCDAPAEICQSGSCTAGCLSAGCPSGERCDPDTGRCEALGTVPLGGSCTVHTDCASDYCLPLTSGNVCSQACAASHECPLDFWCVALGPSGASACLHESLFMTDFGNDPPGSSCTTTNSCKSGWCNTTLDQCTDTCQSDADCLPAGPGPVCTVLEPDYDGDGTVDDFVGVCGGSTGTAVTGQACATGADCRSALCLPSGVCADPCCTSFDCPSGYVCGSVQGTSGDWIRACISAGGSTGTAAVGSTCDPATNAPCRSNWCVSTGGVDYCTDTCCRDADCPSGHRCEVRAFDLDGDGTQDLTVPLCIRR